MTIAHAVHMSRAEAERFMLTINAQRKRIVKEIAAIDRKRSWLAIERDMATQGLRIELDALVLLQERIGTAFNLGGW